jgi:hypothetical protein
MYNMKSKVHNLSLTLFEDCHMGFKWESEFFVGAYPQRSAREQFSIFRSSDETVELTNM